MARHLKPLLACLLLATAVNDVSCQCSATSKRASESVTVTEELVSLYSPGWKIAYYSSMDCRWTLTATGKRVIVDVMESYFEGSPGCTYDYLGLYDGNSLSSSATKLCNNMASGQLYVSSGESVVIRLKSDFSVNYPGFYLKYFSGEDLSGSCGAVSLTADANVAYLTSPGFPDEYNSAQECSWTITSANSKSIRIEVLLSNLLYNAEGCFDDILYIYDGTDDTGTLLAEICDGSIEFTEPEEYITNTTSAFIKFKTRLSEASRRGFYLSYNETDIAVSTGTQTTTPSSTYSSCSSTPVALTASSSPIYITSPDYPIFYSINLNCKWTVSASIGSIIQIKVLDFYLEDSESCFSDRVTIYDGRVLSTTL